MSVVDRLRAGDVSAMAEAADMLEFSLDCMQQHSPHMDGTWCWRWRTAWPLSAVRASTDEGAIRECVRLTRVEGEPA